MNVSAFARAFACVAVLSANAWAIPTNPDPVHTAAATPWPNPLPVGFNPATDPHQHWSTDPITGTAGKFATYSVWDDNTYRYDPNMTTQGHGYMQNPASYEYDASVPLVAQPLFSGNVVGTWEAAVDGPGMNVNNYPVNTLINFVLSPPMIAGDFVVKYDTKYPVLKPNPANPNGPPIPGTQDFPSPGSILPNGTWPGNPGNPGGGPGGGSEGVLAFWTPGLKTLTFNSLVQWYYLDPMVNPAAGQFDFVTTALHEFGHVIGLDHEGPAGGTMFPSQSSFVTNGMGIVVPFDNTAVVRFPDPNAILGSKVLYTIAVAPEPTTAALFSIVAMLAATRRRR